MGGSPSSIILQGDLTNSHEAQLCPEYPLLNSTYWLLLLIDQSCGHEQQLSAQHCSGLFFFLSRCSFLNLVMLSTIEKGCDQDGQPEHSIPRPQAQGPVWARDQAEPVHHTQICSWHYGGSGTLLLSGVLSCEESRAHGEGHAVLCTRAVLAVKLVSVFCHGHHCHHTE